MGSSGDAPTTRKRTRPMKLTEQDIEFIAYSLDEHIHLAENRIGSLWEQNVQKEKQKAYRAVTELQSVMDGRIPLNRELVQFLEFIMTERCDFAAEGHGETWCENSVFDSIKTAHVIRKLKNIYARTATPTPVGTIIGLTTPG